jgi:hypothetical protein
MKEDNKRVILDALGNLPGAANKEVGAPIGKILAQLQHVTGYLKHLEEGIIGLSAGLQRTALVNDMILRLLVDKEIFTKEEVEAKYKTEVYEPIMKANEDLRQRIEDATSKKPQEEQEEIDPEEPTGDVILASERFKREE